MSDTRALSAEVATGSAQESASRQRHGSQEMFSYSGISQVLRAIQELLPVFPLRDWSGQSGVILRHDVDLDILPAVRLAEVEARLDLSRTYFFLTTCDSYNPGSQSNRALLRELATLGFEVGLHFDPTIYPEADEATLLRHVEAEGQQLADIIGAPVRSISLHNPSVHGRYPIFPGWMNAYDPAIFNKDCYLSDSRMIFRSPPVEFLRARTGQISQLLLHPLHYSPDGSAYPEPMAAFVVRFGNALNEYFKMNSTYREAVGDGDFWTFVDASCEKRR